MLVIRWYELDGIFNEIGLSVCNFMQFCDMPEILH